MIVVCGLAAEARIAAGAGVSVLAGGGDADRLALDLDALCREESDIAGPGIISFGVAGGLAPGLAPGAVCVADGLVAPDGALTATDVTWAVRLAVSLADLPAVRGRFATADAPVAGVAAKAALHRGTGALVVDMESHVAARAAARHGLRFAALRVITDPAGRALPHAASVGMRADGRVDLPAILASLARNPRQLPGLIRTGLDARIAFAALLRCRQLLGPGFGLDSGLDFGLDLARLDL